MLIGPTITLAELEKHMEAQKSKNSKEINELARDLEMVHQELNGISMYVRDEKGDRVVNPRYTELKEEFREKEKRYENLIQSNDFIKEKLDEIEDLEIQTNGQFNKEKEKITLSLNDCVLLGVKVE